MNSIQELEAAVARLSSEDFAHFRAWFEEFAAAAWDRQFEQDVQAGKLDKLAEEALRDFQEGRCTEL